MKKLRYQKVKGEQGQLLPLAVILLAAGTLLVMALLPQISTMLQSGYKERELAMARYAAEAGLNRVIADMVRGADAYPTTYSTSQPIKKLSELLFEKKALLPALQQLLRTCP